MASPDSAYPNKGYVTHHITPAHLNDGDVDVYLCGPPPMVEAVSQFIRDCGVTAGQFPPREVRRQRLRTPRMNPDASTDKVAVVTGAAQGIGRRVVERLLRRGRPGGRGGPLRAGRMNCAACPALPIDC